MPLLAVWAVASWRQLAQDPALVLSGALAISTFFSSLSVDYNLITTYPFLIVLFARATAARPNLAAVGLLVIGLAALLGHYAFYRLAGDELGGMAQNWLQWAWLMMAGVAVALSRVATGAGRDTGSDVAPVALARPAADIETWRTAAG